jgi:hypothetical protein
MDQPDLTTQDLDSAPVVVTQQPDQQLPAISASDPVAQIASRMGSFADMKAFEATQRIAKCLCASELVPEAYRGQNKLANCVIALDVARQVGASPLSVMQNLHIIHGRPSWSAQFIVAAVNACGRFSPLRYLLTGEGDDRTCVAWAIDATGERLESPPVSIAMAKTEGWFAKNGSKWKTMPELMLRYRAAAFFGRLYAPDLLMGMHAREEMEDTYGPDRAKRVGPMVDDDVTAKLRGTK